MKGKRRPKPPSTHYSMMDELLASTSQPMPQRNRDYQLKQMTEALQELMQAPKPTNNAWRIDLHSPFRTAMTWRHHRDAFLQRYAELSARCTLPPDMEPAEA